MVEDKLEIICIMVYKFVATTNNNFASVTKEETNNKCVKINSLLSEKKKPKHN